MLKTKEQYELMGELNALRSWAEQLLEAATAGRMDPETLTLDEGRRYINTLRVITDRAATAYEHYYTAENSEEHRV